MSATYGVQLYDARAQIVLAVAARRYKTIETALASVKGQRGWKRGGLGDIQGHVQARVVDQQGQAIATLVCLDVTTVEFINSPIGLLGGGEIRGRAMRWIRVDAALAEQLATGSPV